MEWPSNPFLYNMLRKALHSRQPSFDIGREFSRNDSAICCRGCGWDCHGINFWDSSRSDLRGDELSTSLQIQACEPKLIGKSSLQSLRMLVPYLCKSESFVRVHIHSPFYLLSNNSKEA